MELQGKNFMVTGGSSGIGKAIAVNLIEKGAGVAITGRDEEKLNLVANEIGAIAIAADVAKEEDVKASYAKFFEHFSRLDGLINNAGIGGKFSELTETTLEDFREVYEVNVFGAAMMGREAAKIFKEQNTGNIVNIASTAALKGFGRGTVYSSSKFALRGMTMCWQAELRPHNVRVFLVNPSEVKTAFAKEDREERPEEANKLRSQEIAHTVIGVLEMDDRGYIPEVTVHATNPF